MRFLKWITETDFDSKIAPIRTFFYCYIIFEFFRNIDTVIFTLFNLVNILLFKY